MARQWLEDQVRQRLVYQQSHVLRQINWEKQLGNEIDHATWGSNEGK